MIPEEELLAAARERGVDPDDPMELDALARKLERERGLVSTPRGPRTSADHAQHVADGVTDLGCVFCLER